MSQQIGILILDDDEASQTALREVLDSEGWRVRVVSRANQALPVLATGDYRLVIANVSLVGLSGPLFETLKELALAEAVEPGQRLLRVLFLVPELAGREAQPALERDGLPYSLKPFHLHDFLEKISDLLLQTKSIQAPIRRVEMAAKTPDQRKKSGAWGRQRRETSMFAARDDYVMTEDEILEYERQEKEEEERKKKKKQPNG